jgi:capsular exopolysaccharide synthesis family protein
MTLPPSDPGPQPDLGREYLEDEEGGLDIRRYVAALLRYKWLTLGLGVLGLAAGVGLSKLVKPAYEAQATIQIEPSGRNAQQQGPIRSGTILQDRAWIDLIRSFRVLDEVVKRRRLFVEYSSPDEARFFATFEVGEKFQPGTYQLTADGEGKRLTFATSAGTVLEERAVGDSVGTSVGFLWVPQDIPAGQSITFVVRTPRDAAVRLSESLEIPPLPLDASFLRISLRGTDPVGITATVNTVAERFVEVATFLKKDKLTQVTEVLRAQLARSADDLRRAENALETFKVNTITLPTDRGGGTPIASGLRETSDPVRRAFFDMRIDRDSLQQERDAIERALRVARDSSTSLAIVLGTIPSVRAATDITAALARLGDRRAEARQLRLTVGPSNANLQAAEKEVAELETQTIPFLARSLISNIDQRMRDLDGRLAASGREMQQIPVRVSEESRLERNLDIADNLYTQLQAAYEQANLNELSAAPDVRVLDDAKVPTQPVTDQLLIIIAGGFIGGIGLGLVLSIILDRFDRRIRYPDQVTRELGLNILGALPVIKSGRSGKPDAEQTAHLLEALRSVRMNLTYAHGAAGPFITTVTSPGAGDGKSFLSANLARSFASSGRRTLLIDADTRRGVLHRTMGVDRKPGLLDYLSGDEARERVIRSIPEWGIDFLPCGTRKSGGPELLSSAAMAQLVGSLRTEYQAIIIDSPPLGAGVDPLLLASLTGSMVMVLRTGVTDREFAESRLSDLHRLPIRVLGAVLNDVKAEGIYRYYSYLPGYRAEDEENEDEPLSGPSRVLGPGTSTKKK